jgi:hypothetical protein
LIYRSKCRRFQPPAQWKRFAFSTRGVEAYFRKERLRSGFLLCRYSTWHPAQENPAWSNCLNGLSDEIKLLGKDWWAHQGSNLGPDD